VTKRQARGDGVVAWRRVSGLQGHKKGPGSEHVMMVKRAHAFRGPEVGKAGHSAGTGIEPSFPISKVQLFVQPCGPVRIGHAVQGDRKVESLQGKCGTTLG